ncbi:2-dehydropantoate 2-reductase N-terminal domain-containing protein [Paenibacillus sp. WLX2291]|uniref:2-dehydropantoate 2-reductase N-terminal domain-containing protein n=1 Tax=Paenibacillus sp. WLX2291 TaxID=3296934 RepID=UPI003984221C
MTTNIPSANILIVGAGATGFSVGYHLTLAGAKITFLVRSGRAATVAAPQKLYCYDDVSLKDFDHYDVVDHVEQVAAQSYDFIIITLDGHHSRTSTGKELLTGLGTMARHHGTPVIMCGFGHGLKPFYMEQMGLPSHQLLRGMLGTLAHQSHAPLPVHQPADAEQIAQSIIAYRHPADLHGFRIETANDLAAQQFTDLYNRSQVSLCSQASPVMFDLFSSIGFPVYAACDLAGWRPFAEVVHNQHVWTLACAAQSEIASLPQHGAEGQQMSQSMNEQTTAYIHQNMEQQLLPLDYQAFNQFHHGGKVAAQDTESMRYSLAEGQRSGHPMTALQQLLQLLDERADADNR